MLIVTTAATVEPVTLAEAKAHLRVTHSSDDDLITALIPAAREAVEQATGRALAAAAYRWASEDDINTALRLPLWPVATVTAVSYEDGDGARQTMDPADYTLDGDRSLVTIDEPPDYGVRWSVSFTVAPANVPVAVKHAILLLVGDLYVNAEATMNGDSVADNPAADRLLYPYRVSLGV
jgi:uncharacterized phiE125 gp8 family phage protein